MMNRCVFCGETLNEIGVCPNMAQHFKPMCLNCTYCQNNLDNCTCQNEDNKKDAEEQIRKSYDGAYEITTLTLSPLPLKDPSKKCKRYTFDADRLIRQINL